MKTLTGFILGVLITAFCFVIITSYESNQYYKEGFNIGYDTAYDEMLTSDSIKIEFRYTDSTDVLIDSTAVYHNIRQSYKTHNQRE